MIELPVLRGQDKIAPFYSLWKDKARFAGGYIRYMVSPHEHPAPAGDIDIYPNSADDKIHIVKDMLHYFGIKKPQFQSPVAFSYELQGDWKNFPKLQIMSTEDEGNFVVEGTLEVLISSFDFTVITAGLLDINRAIVHDDFVKHEMRKWLVINNIHCPISAVKRIAKYTKKGYYINPFEIFKLFQDWENRDEDYRQELEGVLRAAYDREGGREREDLENLIATPKGRNLFKLLYVD